MRVTKDVYRLQMKTHLGWENLFTFDSECEANKELTEYIKMYPNFNLRTHKERVHNPNAQVTYEVCCKPKGTVLTSCLTKPSAERELEYYKWHTPRNAHKLYIRRKVYYTHE